MKNIQAIQETISEPLNKNAINVYELLDNFVSFLIALKLSAESIKFVYGCS